MIKLNKVLVLSITLFGLLITGCSSDDDDLVGNWVTVSAFDGPARSSAVSFVIDNMGYVATGYTGDEYLDDLWVYDPDGDYWEQKADFPGVARSSAAAFELNSKGYVGLGYDGTNKLGDFYQYDPTSNTWTAKADFGGSARYGAVGFQVNENAYFGTGYDGNYLKDFYKYDDATDTWTQAVGFGGNKRKNGTVFVIDGKAYLGTGISNSVDQIDFWEFDGTTLEWTQLRDIDNSTDDDDYNYEYDILRANASSFVMDGIGYVMCGDSTTDVWAYDPSDDSWEEKTSLEASGRLDACAFSLNDRGFVMLGRSGTSYYDDMMEFYPNDDQEDDD
jgi:N-acetylneuraminic acid mutarotase